jgi:branched-chain amino acid aminotransferase
MTSKLKKIEVVESTFPRWKDFDFTKAEFGLLPTDHMFKAEFSEGKWNKPRVVPLKDLNISPLCAVFHYGQTVFEGMKAFRMIDNKVAIFRPSDHAKRFNKSLSRMCMPNVPLELFVDALTTLVDIDKNWVPRLPDSSLYIRPFMFASDERLGVRTSDNYTFIVVCSPSLAYYSKPLKVKVETTFSRAFNGGTGFTKCGGNYGGSFYAYKLALEQGFDQVIWTDAFQHEFIEESGTMNLGFIYNKTLYTPPTSETILEGITRDSILKIAPSLGLNAEVKEISVIQLENVLKSGKQIEAFGIGTAATIAPICQITIGSANYDAYTGSDAYMYLLKKRLEEIRIGTYKDEFGWNMLV